MTKPDYLDPSDDWSVPKLIGITFAVLAAAFAIIWTISP
jgi:hypothetical protein